ncbi:beta-galactosidase trimerization domain-containing protein [Phycisphaerales bacterium AB-hyl4]|uniref:Beta-galactosidase trimerization domain-containing protein n=1 Tax=Natronomicrosphaera hydrolytica TaxID=3242702 RepID=A0ABV4U2W4_9BACT
MTSSMQSTAAYTREHWSKWFCRDLFHMCYWPKYIPSQGNWVNTPIDELVNQLVEGGIQVLNWGGPENWFPINAGMHQRHPALEERDSFFDELIAACHEKGIRFVIGFSGNGGREGKAEFIKQNWDAFKRQGAHWEIEGVKLGGHEVCLFNPLFVKGVQESVQALCERYPVDGVVIDTPVHRVPVDAATGVITCEYCQAEWEKVSGLSKAPREDWDDPQWRQFVAWQQQISVPHLQMLRETIKQVDEKLLVTANMVARPVDQAIASTPNPASMRGVIDSMCYESVFLIYNLLDVSLNLKFGRAITGYNPGCILKNFELIFGGGYAHAEPSAIETETLAYLSLAHGSWVNIHSTMDEDGRPHERRTQVYIDTCRKLQPDLPYFADSEPLASVGVVYSRLTRDNYAGRNPASFLTSYQGAEQALTYMHVPSRPLLDEDLTKEQLAKHKAVLLPNVACMSDASVKAVRDYVADGGTILASYETSLYDADERFRGDFGLADVFGVSLNGTLPLAEKIVTGREKWKRQPFKLTGHPLLSELIDSEILHVPWFSIRPDSAEVMANWLEVREGTDQGCVNMGREIIGEYDEPCITVNTFGKGRAIYFSGDMFYNFSMRPLRYFTQMLRSLLLGTDSLEVYSDAPKSLELTVMKQAADDRINVHLVNMTNTNRWYNGMLFARRNNIEPLTRTGVRDDFPDEKMRRMAMAYRTKDTGDTQGAIDEYLPMQNVRVYLDKAMVKDRTVLVDGEPTTQVSETSDGFVCVTVPELAIYGRITLQA